MHCGLESRVKESTTRKLAARLALGGCLPCWRGVGSCFAENLLESLTPVIEYPVKVWGDKKLLDHCSAGYGILDPVSHKRTILVIGKRMLMTPETIGAPTLLVHKTMRRLPDYDLALPMDGNSVQSYAVVDQCPRLHSNGSGGQDCEVQPWGGEDLQVARIREEPEYLLQRSRQPLFAPEGVRFHTTRTA